MNPARAIAFIFLLVFVLTSLPVFTPASAWAAPSATGEEEIPEESSPARIYILPFEYTDCIVLESDGLFGIVDSGEDDDFPDGTDPRYPLRSGITQGQGVQDEVIAFLYSLGVTKDNLEFYIGTHPHSDHIGSAAQIIREFSPKRVYTPEYEDSYISNENSLWDNLFVYDRLVAAAEEQDIPLILNLDPAAPLIPVEYGGETDAEAQTGSDSDEDTESEPGEALTHAATPYFTLGQFQISIMNWENTDYKLVPVADCNYFSWGVLAEAYGKRAFLAGDITNYRGAEERLGAEIGKVDVLKLAHHGFMNSNTPVFLQALQPDYAFQTGAASRLTNKTHRALLELGTQIYSSDMVQARGYTVMTTEFSSEGVTVNTEDDVEFWHVTEEAPYVYVSCNGLPVNVTGWRTAADRDYFFDNSPYPARNAWATHRGLWYWFDDEAKPVTGWQDIDAERYCFDENGIMRTGFYTENGKRYFLDPANGHLRTGWITYGRDRYYLGEDGAACTGWQDIDGERCLFAADGALRTGWVREGSNWLYLRIGSGRLATGWYQDKGTWYYSDAKGIMQTGWLLDNGTWYYLEPSGAMATGWLLDKGEWYWLDASGAMATGWYRVNGTWYYSAKNGVMQTGWLHDGKSWYYLKDSGAMATGWLWDKGEWYWLNGHGAMFTGWLREGSTWYYLKASGAMATGACRVDGNVEYFGPSGAWLG